MSEEKRSDLISEIAEVLNSSSREGVSDTPDFILAEYMVDALEAFEKSINEREGFYGREAAQQKLEWTAEIASEFDEVLSQLHPTVAEYVEETAAAQ